MQSFVARVLRLATCVPIMVFFPGAGFSVAAHRPGPTVPLCSRQITFRASYLAETTPGAGPSYLFQIENATAKPLKLAAPVPSSAHWYARVGNRWLWRASSGAGGSYVDAINEKGAVFAYKPKDAPAQPKYLIVPAHGNYEWTAGEHEIPALSYKPSCALCNYPGEHEYKAVFAYAYLPHPEEHETGLLACGLRSNLVDMPPTGSPK
jgi:hypothetical protein